MKSRESRTVKSFSIFLIAAFIVGVLAIDGQAANLSPTLRQKLNTVADNLSVGVTIISFNTANGLNESHLNVLRAVGITGGQTFPTLGMVAAPMTAGQVLVLQSNAAIRAIWSNDKLRYFMNQARTLTGVDKIRPDAAMTVRNGTIPVSGAGNFRFMVIDSGVDAASNVDGQIKQIPRTILDGKLSQ